MKPHFVMNIVEQGNEYIYPLVSPFTKVKVDQRLCYERLSQADETLQNIFFDTSSTTQQVAIEPERRSTQVELPAVTLGISPHHMLQSPTPRAVNCLQLGSELFSLVDVIARCFITQLNELYRLDICYF